MPRLLAIRMSLAIAALALFGLGIRSDSTYLRLAGIVLLGAALILRFAGGRTPGI